MTLRPKQAKRTRTRWDPEAERRLIEIWADVLVETDGLMLTRKKKEMQATARLNESLTEESKYTVKDVHNKIDSIL